MNRAEIITAIEHELEHSNQPLRFEVMSVRREPLELWSVFVRPATEGRSGLDESLEGAAAWWPGPPGQPPGSGDVLAVIPSVSQIALRFVQGSAPRVGDKLRIYPPPFLAALLNAWRDVAWSGGCLGWRDRTSGTLPATRLAAGVPGGCSLRPGQERAFRLPRFERSYLWGPPGTGKTHTLGFLIGAYLRRFDGFRVLLLATTNVAVDLAITSADRALEKLEGSPGSPSELRRSCKRLGNHFVARQYDGRRHLLPVQDSQLLAQLAFLEANRPDRESIQAFAEWTRDVEALRARLRRQNVDILQNARLAAMTACFAAFVLQDLRAFAPFDLVVFDESSQVAQAYALALAPLGKAVVFAGDPKQLGPIVQSNHPSAQRWLGTSMFDEMDDGSENVAFLDEQSRMAQPICDLVSRLFYRGRLRVAKNALDDPRWLERREVRFAGVKRIGDRRVLRIEQEAVWSRQHNGPIRPESADAVAQVVEKIAESTPAVDILVVTPFRGQRTLIRDRLKRAGLKDVDVSTVHRAQGGERHTVIFDPVQGSSAFLQSEEARRLINVALSRAMARVIVLLSPGDKENDLLRRIAVVITNDESTVKTESIAPYLARPDFPRCLMNRVIRIPGTPDIVGRVIRETTREFVLEDLHDGRERTIRVETLRRAHGVKADANLRNPQNGTTE